LLIRFIRWKIIDYRSFEDETLTLLPNQGHCNLNFSFEKEGKKYHLRKYKLADRDRKLEFKIQNLAFKKGIGAKAYYHDKSIMIGDFIEGVHQKKLCKKELRLLALTIKKLHKIKLRKKPTLFPQAKKFKKELVLCHGDLSVKNILFAQRVKLIDWEYAGVCDRYFDLASVCLEFKLNKAEEAYFFRAYGIKIDHKKLKVYKDVFMRLSKEWFEKLEKGELDFI